MLGDPGPKSPLNAITCWAASAVRGLGFLGLGCMAKHQVHFPTELSGAGSVREGLGFRVQGSGFRD